MGLLPFSLVKHLAQLRLNWKRPQIGLRAIKCENLDADFRDMFLDQRDRVVDRVENVALNQPLLGSVGDSKTTERLKEVSQSLKRIEEETRSSWDLF